MPAATGSYQVTSTSLRATASPARPTNRIQDSLAASGLTGVRPGGRTSLILHPWPYRLSVASSVFLEVTAVGEVQEDRSNYAPAAVLRLVASYGQNPNHGMSRRGKGGPWRYHWQLSGPDRVQIGRDLEKRLRDLGYDADVSFSP